MDARIKMLLNGAPVRMITEGAFSEIHIQITDDLESLISMIQRVGDFQVGNSLNPNYTQIKTAFDSLLNELDQYHLNTKQFVDAQLKANPNITYIELLKMIQEKFL